MTSAEVEPLLRFGSRWIMRGDPFPRGYMAGRPPTPVTLSDRQRDLLKRWERAASSPQNFAMRCRILLLCADGVSGTAQVALLGIERQRVTRWRKRWAAAQPALAEAEAAEASDADFERLVRDVLSDRHRSGAPATFSAEQVTLIIALACEEPADSGLPVSHWTPVELAREAIERGIVDTISPRQVDRFLAQRAFGHTSQSTG